MPYGRFDRIFAFKGTSFSTYNEKQVAVKERERELRSHRKMYHLLNGEEEEEENLHKVPFEKAKAVGVEVAQASVVERCLHTFFIYV